MTFYQELQLNIRFLVVVFWSVLYRMPVIYYRHFLMLT